MPSRKIILTGGPCSGKSYFAWYLSQKGTLLPEAAMQVVGGLKKRLGLEGVQAWMPEHWEALYTMMGYRQAMIDNEAPRSGLVVSDRSMIDYLAFCRLRNVQVPDVIRERATRVKADRVFLCDVLSSFDQRSSSGRIITQEESVRLGEMLFEIYTAFGLKPIPIPEFPGKKVNAVRGRREYIESFL